MSIVDKENPPAISSRVAESANFAHSIKVVIGFSLIAALLYSTATNLHTLSLWQLAAAVLFFSLLIMVAGVYISTLGKIHESTLFRAGGWLRWLVTSRLMSYLSWMVWGLVSSYVMLISLHFNTSKDWQILFSVFPLFLLLFSLFKRVIKPEINELHITAVALKWTRILIPILLVFIYFPIVLSSKEVAESGTLRDSIEERRAEIVLSNGTAIVDESMKVYSAYLGAQDWVSQNLSEVSIYVSALLKLLAVYMIGFNASLLFSVFVIPRPEYRRLVGVMSEDKEPPLLSVSEKFSVSAISILFIYFVYVEGVAGLESMLRNNETYIESRNVIEREVSTLIDLVDGNAYLPGTVDRIQAARATVVGLSEADSNRIEDLVDTAFLAMEANVDRYLDWYYSLMGENVRILNVMTGSIEEYMLAKFQEYIFEPEAMGRIDQEYARFIRNNAELLASFEKEKNEILSQNVIEMPDGPILINKEATLTSFEMPEITMTTSVSQRGSIALVSGVIAAKITSKIVAKAGFKLAVKALSKVAIQGASTVAGSAAGGAALGSIIPGLGTVVGAAVGVGVGLVIDWGMLRREESIGREAFKNELLSSLREAKAAYLSEGFNAASSSVGAFSNPEGSAQGV